MPLTLIFGRRAIPRNVPTIITDTSHLQLQNPLSSNDIAKTLGELVEGANIPGALQLKPMEELSLYLQCQKCFI